jgi:hypothetical protein
LLYTEYKRVQLLEDSYQKPLYLDLTVENRPLFVIEDLLKEFQ